MNTFHVEFIIIKQNITFLFLFIQLNQVIIHEITYIIFRVYTSY
jgi:hypothetical protein